MTQIAVRFKVEKLRDNGEWDEVLSLTWVYKGEQFRIYAFDGVTIAKQGTAVEDGYLNSEGMGCCEFEWGNNEGDCDNDPLTEDQKIQLLKEAGGDAGFCTGEGTL